MRTDNIKISTPSPNQEDKDEINRKKYRFPEERIKMMRRSRQKREKERSFESSEDLLHFGI